jgi:hypothetical protein
LQHMMQAANMIIVVGLLPAVHAAAVLHMPAINTCWTSMQNYI